MKKFELNQTSDFICSTATVISVLWVFLMIGVFLVFPNIFVIVLMVIVPIFLIAIIIYCMGKKTIVEYDDNKIQWKWQWLTYTVNFNEMQSVHYTITSESTRGGYIRRFEIVFKVDDEEELRLNDIINTEDIENSINGTPDDIQLMQWYKFIENIYPEKSLGFIKNSDEIF